MLSKMNLVIVVILYSSVLISSCAPPASFTSTSRPTTVHTSTPSPVLTITPTETQTPRPTPEPTKTPTFTPTETPGPFADAISIGYHQQYFTERGYTSLSYGAYEQGGVLYNAMYAEKADGTKVLIGMDVGGRMRQASRYENANGFTGSVWFTPTTREEGNLLEGIVSLNPENAATQIFESLIKAVAEQKGTQPENIEAGLLTGCGQMNIRVPVQQEEGYFEWQGQTLYREGWWIEWPQDKTLNVDLTKPVELRSSVGPKTEPSLFSGIPDQRDILIGYVGNSDKGYIPAQKASVWVSNDDRHMLISGWSAAHSSEVNINRDGMIARQEKDMIVSRLDSILSAIDTISNVGEWKGFYNTLGIGWRRTEDVFYVPITK